MTRVPTEAEIEAAALAIAREYGFSVSVIEYRIIARSALTAAYALRSSEGEDQSGVVEQPHVSHRKAALARAVTIDGARRAGFIDPPNDLATTLAIICAEYGVTLGDDGRVVCLVAGDMGYAATDLVLDADTLAIWKRVNSEHPEAAPPPSDRNDALEEAAKAADLLASIDPPAGNKDDFGIFESGNLRARRVAEAIRALKSKANDGVQG